MFRKYYYYEVAVTTRPDGALQPVVGIITSWRWESPEIALNKLQQRIEKDEVVNYGFFIREFRNVK